MPYGAFQGAQLALWSNRMAARFQGRNHERSPPTAKDGFANVLVFSFREFFYELLKDNAHPQSAVGLSGPLRNVYPKRLGDLLAATPRPLCCQLPSDRDPAFRSMCNSACWIADEPLGGAVDQRLSVGYAAQTPWMIRGTLGAEKDTNPSSTEVGRLFMIPVAR